MHEAEKLSLEAISRFVEASEEIRFESKSRPQVYGWVARVLIHKEYARQGKAARGLVRRYIEKMSGMSRAQTTRLIGRYTASGLVRPTVYRRRSFPERYTRSDIELLVSVDEAHETLSGPATRRILEREHQLYLPLRDLIDGVDKLLILHARNLHLMRQPTHKKAPH